MYFLTPRDVTSTTAYLWLAAVDEAKQAKLSLDPNLATLPKKLDTWPPDEPARLQHCEVQITGLTPGQTYEFALLADGKAVAHAKFTTLPSALPLLAASKPFTVLLGSCFALMEDEGGTVGKAFSRMPPAARPDIKILAGDQVYLDSPAWHFGAPHSYDDLRDRFLGQYKGTWGQTNGFAELLSKGANFFCSDDHEYWNNAPSRSFPVNTWLKQDRDMWWDAAHELYRAFQTPRPLLQFDVSPLSFMIADTRIDRDNKTFIPKARFANVEAWVKGLKGPGVLVIGQPLLWRPTDWYHGSVYDWNLPDYDQYQDLVRIVAASPHSLIILTGDVHFGRIAYGRLKSGGELVEIISSPLSLIDKLAAGEWEEAPPTFPIVRPEQVTAQLLATNQMITKADFQATAGHFLTLEFTQQGPGAKLKLRYWPVDADAPPKDFGKTIWDRTFI